MKHNMNIQKPKPGENKKKINVINNNKKKDVEAKMGMC